MSISKSESKRAFAAIDSDGSGKISFDEFLPWFSKLSLHHGLKVTHGIEP